MKIAAFFAMYGIREKIAAKEHFVNTGNTHTPLLPEAMSKNTSAAPPVQGPDKAPPLPEEAGLFLARTVEEAALSTVLPSLRDALERMDQQTPDQGIMETLVQNITTLQNSFMQALYESLDKAGVDISCKFSLRLDEKGELCVAGEHPEKEKIRDVLRQYPEFAAGFSEIATQCAALRDLRNLRILALYHTAVDRYAALATMPGESRYQLSLKGDLNHFYFTR